MNNNDLFLAKDGIKRIVDLEKIRARRSALKQLLLGTGVITTGGLASAQTNRGISVLPIAKFLIFDDADKQCGNPSTPETPTEIGITPPSEFVLNATNYTATVTQQTEVTSEGLAAPVCVTVTYSVCMEVVSSDENLAKVNIDLIAIIEGLSNLDATNVDPAVDYYFRSGRPYNENGNSEERASLNELPIERESMNTYTAKGGQAAGTMKSCGFVDVNLPFKLSIKNNRPVMQLGQLSRNISELSYTLAPMQINLAPGDCTHPDRFENSCIYTNSNGEEGSGPNMLTTPEPIGGPIL